MEKKSLKKDKNLNPIPNPQSPLNYYYLFIKINKLFLFIKKYFFMDNK